MTRIAAKPTLYRGVAFRSRLEARWAVVFDELGIFWEYEPITFPVDGSGYTPDFRITYGHAWGDCETDDCHKCQFDFVEVKPATHLVPVADVERLVRFARGCWMFHDHVEAPGMHRSSLLLLGSLPRIGDPRGCLDPIWCSIAGAVGLGGTDTMFAETRFLPRDFIPGSVPMFDVNVGGVEMSSATWEPRLSTDDADPELIRAIQVAQLTTFRDFPVATRGA